MIPSWIGKPMPGGYLSPVRIDPEWEQRFSPWVSSRERRTRLMEQCARLFLQAPQMEPLFEKSLGAGSLVCTDNENLIWQNLFEQGIDQVQSSLAQYRFQSLLGNPSFFLF